MVDKNKFSPIHVLVRVFGWEPFWLIEITFIKMYLKKSFCKLPFGKSLAVIKSTVQGLEINKWFCFCAKES